MLLSILNLLKMKLPCTGKFQSLEAEFKANNKGLVESKPKKLASPAMRALSPTASQRTDASDGFEQATSMFSKGK